MSNLERYFRLRDKARKNVRFLAYMLHYDVLVKNWTFFHQEANDIADKYNFFFISLPRGFFKTSLMTISKRIQRILNDPEIRQLILSYTGANAKSMLLELSSHFLVNDNLRFLFPDICPKNTARPETGKWNMDDGITIKRKQQWKECSVEALGADQNPVSKHYDVIDIDDIFVFQNTRTAQQITNTIEFLKKVPALLNNHNANRQMFFVGNPWVPDDGYAKIKDGSFLAPDGEKYKVYEVPAESGVGENRTPSYPKLFPLSVLDGLKKQDEITYSAFYLLDPDDMINAIWNLDMLQFYQELPQTIDGKLLDKEKNNVFDLMVYGGVDPGISEKDVKSGSDTANIVIGIDRNNHVWVLDYENRKDVDWLNDSIFTLYERHKNRNGKRQFRWWSIETKAFQKLLARDLRKEMQIRGTWIPINEFTPVTDKTSRIMVLDGLIKNKAFHIRSDMHELKSQIIRFGRPNIKNDLLDAIAQAYSSSKARSQKKRESNEIPWNQANLLGGVINWR